MLHRLSRWFFVLLFALWVIPQVAPVVARADVRSAEETEVARLPVLRVEDSSPSDLLNQDSLLPIWSSKIRTQEGSGDIQSNLLSELPLPSTNGGGAGTMSQFRGLGQSAEDTQVQAFGVSLNPPQGGGFDFSAFPQFLWSDYQFQLTPAPGSLNLQANAGVLTLVPWTQQAVSNPSSTNRFSVFGSGSGIQQFAAGLRSNQNMAVLAGWSTGKTQGPSGSISGKWSAGPVRGQYHFLGTSLEVEVPGPVYARTPRARQTTVRVLPVLQADVDLARGMLLKTSAFFDALYIASDTPETPDRGRNQTRQWGASTALLWRNWKFGASLKRATINNSYVYGSGIPSLSYAAETIGSLQAAPMIEIGRLQIEPTVQLLSVQRYDASPAGSLGARYSLSGGQALYARVAYSNRYPTLLERYAQNSQFVGNPDLEVEKDWTGILGWELKRDSWEIDLQAYGQVRNDSIPSFGTPNASNLGRATVVSAIHTVRHHLSNQLSVRESGSVSDSRVSRTGVAFPYLPTYAQTLALEFAERSDAPRWMTSLSARTQTRVVAPVVDPVTYGADLKAELPSWTYFDWTGRWTVFQRAQKNGALKVDLFGQVENFFDRRIEFIRDYPGDGRVASLGIMGQF